MTTKPPLDVWSQPVPEQETLPSIINIPPKDVPLSADTLTRGFRGDPLFTYIFDNPKHYDQVAPWMFSTWIRWCILYGKAWATPRFEAVALRRLPGRYDMSLWTLFRAGILLTPLKLGKASFQRFERVIHLIEQQHKVIMGEQPHWYCQTIAVVPAQQGKGFGRRLMQHTFAFADAEQLPCYLETTTTLNIEIHQQQGYKVREVIRVPDSELTLTFMVREPKQG